LLCEVSAFWHVWSCEEAQVWLTLGLVIAAFLALPIVWYQLHIQGVRERLWKTLEACRLYDTDPVIQEASRLLNDAMGPGDDFTKLDRAAHDLAATTMLNYLDGIASTSALAIT